MKLLKIFLIQIIGFHNIFYLFAQDINWPIANTDETIVIDKSQENNFAKTIKQIKNIPITWEIISKTISNKKESTIQELTSLELNITDPITYKYPRQYILNSTSLGSLELSNKPKWIKPEDNLYIEDAKIDPKSIKSFDAQVKGMTYCSWITRNNIERLTKLQDRDTIKWFDGKGILIGDAITIIEQGLKTNIFKEVYLDDDSIEKYISRVNRHTKATIFDIYIHHTKIENRFFAGHRVTGFLGTDNKWYILDPVMTHNKDAILLKDYFKKYGKQDQDRIYILKIGYIPNGYSVDPYPIMAIKFFSELNSLIDHEDIVVTNSGVQTLVAFNTDIRFLAEYSFIDISAWTIMILSWSINDTFSITGALWFSENLPILPWRSLWSATADIRFSQPVKFAIFAEWENTTPFTPLVLNSKGDRIDSISKQSDVSCNQNGIVSKTFQETENRLDHNRASFYSCYGWPFSIVPWIALWLDIVSDGTSPFHNNSYDGILYQWQDSTGSNLLVRAWDNIDYRVSIFGSNQVQENLMLDLRIEGTTGVTLWVFSSLPQDCLSWSYLTGKNSELHCLIDKNFLHDTFAFHVNVIVDKNLENQSKIHLTSSVLYQKSIFLDKRSLDVVVTNYFDNSTFTKISETMKKSSEFLLDSFKPF